MSNPFPKENKPIEIWRMADAEQIEIVRQTQQRIEELEKGKIFPVSKLWKNHFQSVIEFKNYITRNGGKYGGSLMETIRSFLGKTTIGSK